MLEGPGDKMRIMGCACSTMFPPPLIDMAVDFHHTGQPRRPPELRVAPPRGSACADLPAAGHSHAAPQLWSMLR